jgi:hypothetical protein
MIALFGTKVEFIVKYLESELSEVLHNKYNLSSTFRLFRVFNIEKYERP